MSFCTLRAHEWMIDFGTLQGNVNLFFERSFLNSGCSPREYPLLFSLLARFMLAKEDFFLRLKTPLRMPTECSQAHRGCNAHRSLLFCNFLAHELGEPLTNSLPSIHISYNRIEKSMISHPSNLSVEPSKNAENQNPYSLEPVWSVTSSRTGATASSTVRIETNTPSLHMLYRV